MYVSSYAASLVVASSVALGWFGRPTPTLDLVCNCRCLSTEESYDSPPAARSVNWLPGFAVILCVIAGVGVALLLQTCWACVLRSVASAISVESVSPRRPRALAPPLYDYDRR